MRRPLIAAGYRLAALGKVLIALAYVWPLVLAARVIDRTGKGVRSAPRDSLLVDGVAAGYRVRQGVATFAPATVGGWEAHQ